MKRTLIACGLLLASATAWSTNDLVTAWQAASSHDPSHQADVAGALAGSQKHQQARALWMPTMALQAGAGYIDTKNVVDGASFSAPALGSTSNARFVTQMEHATDSRATLVATMPLYNPERRATAAQLGQQSQLAGLQLKESDHALFLRVAQSYFDVLAAEDTLSSLLAHKRAVQESLDIAKEKFRIGKSASTDMHEAQASFDGVLAEEAAVSSDLELKRSLFSDLTGLPATWLARLREGITLDGLRQSDLPALIAKAMTQNPKVQMSGLGQEIAAQEIEKYRLAGSVSVDLVAQYVHERIDGNNAAGSAYTSNRSGWLGVQLNLPLFTGGMRGAKQAEAIALADKARLESEATRQMVAQRVRSAYLAMQTGLLQIQAYQQGVVSAASKLDATQTGQELGARTTSDVLNAQQAFFGVKNNLLRAHYQVMLSALALAAACGDLDLQRLEAVNAFLAR
jgi:outer membrane protein